MHGHVHLGDATSPVVTVRIDKTPPTAPVATPARGPDSNGWYNRSVGVGFSATDAVSGIGKLHRRLLLRP